MTPWSGIDFVSDKKKNEPVRDINELSQEEYEERILKPNKARTRAEMDRIAEARAQNFQKAKKKERERKARRGLFEIYADEPQLKGWFDEPRILDD